MCPAASTSRAKLVAGTHRAPFCTPATWLNRRIVAVVRSPVRRALQTAAAVLTAGIVAGIRGASLPFDGRSPPTVRIAATDDPFTIVGALWGALLSRPALAVEAIVLAVVAVALPYARSRGLWAVAALGAGFLVAALLVVPTVAAAPLVVAVWATCLVVAVR